MLQPKLSPSPRRALNRATFVSQVWRPRPMVRAVPIGVDIDTGRPVYTQFDWLRWQLPAGTRQSDLTTRA